VSDAYDGNGRLLRAGTRTFAYDANGNLINAASGISSRSYEYDGLNRLVRSTTATGATEYAYDAMGHRVLKKDDTGSTRYLIDPFGAGELSRVLGERSATGSVDYVFAGGILMSMRRPTGTSFYLHDGGKSTRMLATTAGDLTDRYDYDAFGNVLSHTGTTPNQYLFDGQELDANLGFYNLRARYYDSSAGRFIARDSHPGIISEPASLHPYIYAYNDPVNKSDPSGEFTLIEQITVAATVGVLAGIAYAGHNYYYYRSAELAFEVGVDAAFSYGSLALDIIGLGGLARTVGREIVSAVGSVLGGRTLVGQTGANIGKSVTERLTGILENVLCRTNMAWQCGNLIVRTSAEAAADIAKAKAQQEVAQLAADAAKKEATTEWLKKLGVQLPKPLSATLDDVKDVAVAATGGAVRTVVKHWEKVVR
jgi:RHS repeat-associated protein